MDDTFDLLPVTARCRPALARIDYAADDLASLRARLLQRLPLALPGWNPQLAQAGTDHGVLLTELFAQMAAILQAYTDQRANEGFLRTATQARSLIDLAQLIDYRLGNGASASALQAFFAKPGQSGRLAAGFRLNALPGAGAPALVFETSAALDVDASRNLMRLSGHDRCDRLLRLRAAAGDAQDTVVLLDGLYGGLKAGVPVVFEALDDGVVRAALPPSAVTEVDGATRLGWTAGRPAADLDLPIADLTLHGRPQQTARLAAAERADEITLGQNQLPVANASMFAVGGAVLVDSGGLQMAATVLARQVIAGKAPAGTVTLSRGVPGSLRRSATRVLEGTACGYAGSAIAAGSTVLVRQALGGKKKDFPHTPAPGDRLLIVDAAGVETATVAAADGIFLTLTQPTTRALRPTGHAFDPNPTIRFYMLAPDDPATHQTPLRPLLLGELGGIYAAGATVLALDKSVDAFAAGTLVALGDGAICSAHAVREAASVDGRTVLTLEGSAPAGLRVAFLQVHGAFEHAMHVAGFDHAEGQLAAGASQLDIDGAPAGLAAGLDLVIADGVHAEGARITQVQPLADRVRLSLARPLDFAYAIGDAVVHGNVVEVTHGAADADEVLGSGDPAAAPQRFVLRRSPLAWIADPAAARGVAPAVEVFVAGERWTRVDTLADSGPQDRHVVIEIDERERASVVFGDGSNGAAAPSGRNNIVARYRAGLGAAANVAAGAISKMPHAAPFIASSLNPAAAGGGADRESPAQARRQARLRVRTLERAVSVADHADLALTCAGIGKALAAVEREGLGAGARRVIVVTCAAAGGGALSTPQKEALLAFLAARSPQPERLRIRDHRDWPVRLALTVQVLPDFRQAAVQRALLAAFGSDDDGFFAFGQRELGTDLVLSDVYGLAERTPGVDHVLATLFHAAAAAPGVTDRIAVPVDALATRSEVTLQLIGGLS